MFYNADFVSAIIVPVNHQFLFFLLPGCLVKTFFVAILVPWPALVCAFRGEDDGPTQENPRRIVEKSKIP